MSTPILATKLYIPPPRPKVVPRRRLLEQLNQGLHRKLTLISAPAGFGKSTLVSEWVAARTEDRGLRTETSTSSLSPQSSALSTRVAWLSLDQGDSDPTRFLAYLVAALQTIAANLGAGVLAVLQSPQPPPTESILTALLNEIATIPDHFVLVLDDYHALDSKSIDAALTFLLEHLPPQMHMVIATREDPQLPLARLRVRGQLTELRAADLRFTPDEAAGFLTQVMELELSASDIAALEERTEGWIAGLQLAALSMRGRDDVARFVRSFAGDNRYIVDYLVEEVLQRQPEHIRSFLLQTAILERLSGPLCDAILGQIQKTNDESSASFILRPSSFVLEELERANLFVVPLDDKRHWFRYHHLFADVLAAHALQEQPAQIPILHQRASAWYADNGLPADAIRHALAAKDFTRAAGLVELAWPAMDGRFQAATWLSWVKALPDELVRARPVLSVAYAWALLNGGELEAAEARLGDAERWLDASAASSEGLEALSSRIVAEPAAEMIIVDAEQFRNLPASIATARAYQAQARGDISGSINYGRRALDLLPEHDHLRRGPATALLALAHWASGDLEAAHQTLAEAMANFRKVGNLHFAISGTYGLADIRTAQGQLHEAVKTYTQVLQLALAQGEPFLRGTADLYLGLSELYREQGDLEAATQHLLKSEELGDQAGLPDWRYRMCRAQARFKATNGDLAGALDLLEEAERHYHRTPVPDVRPLAALRTRVWLAQGRLSEALRWAHEQGLSADDELSFLREFEHITLARVLIAQYARGHADRAIREALKLLGRLQEAAEAGARIGSAIEIAVLRALAHQAQGQLAPALAALDHALMLAEPEGYIRIFVDEGPAMARLLSTAAAQGMRLDYIGKLVAACNNATKSREQAEEPSPSSSVVGSSSLVEPLSQRELEVLHLIAQGRSNREISERLFLALSTVKGHNQKIFDKLQVQSRTQAVARARELDLL
ncbi:MAG TPA: LuxR C-terminal-related transcriptional regulator [Roseiflexaceae bacterium]|nr:LuxR C-terminal-related transcriptional regulator [Roseiflexaceae bacterium]